MTVERAKDIQQSVVEVLKGFGVDFSASHQSISFIGMRESRRDISIKEFVEALMAMEGVELDIEKHQIHVPTSYFK